jgi:hypothetical protein
MEVWSRETTTTTKRRK